MFTRKLQITKSNGICDNEKRYYLILDQIYSICFKVSLFYRGF
jgi:hypothetical protein